MRSLNRYMGAEGRMSTKEKRWEGSVVLLADRFRALRNGGGRRRSELLMVFFIQGERI